MAVLTRLLQRRTAAGSCQLGVSAKSQQYRCGVNRQRLARLPGSIALGIDRVRQQRHVAEDLIGIGPFAQQPSQGLSILLLHCLMGRGPVVTHQDIQLPAQYVYQRLSTAPFTNRDAFLAGEGEGLETPEGLARGAGCEGEAPGGVIGGVKVGLLPPTASS